MSYVRWSNYSDVYAYADVSGGFTIHIAARRRRRGGPRMSLAGINRFDTWWWKKLFWYRYKLYSWSLAVYNWVFPAFPIGLEHDGKSFNLSTFHEYLEVMIELRDMGYYVPEHVTKYAREAQHLDCQGEGCEHCDQGEKRE